MTRSLSRSFLIMASCLILLSGQAYAQPGSAPDERPPVAQPLVREGDLAVKLTKALNLGTPANEAEAESILGSVGIVPRNGWIADYPVTPDIIGELQTSVAEAAAAGKLAMGKDAALNATREVIEGYHLSIRTDVPVQGGSTAPGTNYPESPVINNYYYDEGPPVVTYYAPPPDYAYMYTWVPYPFWWWNFWYPGYFILVDFHVPVYWYGYGTVYVSNHYRDVSTGGIVRIDPANRARGGTYPNRSSAGLSSPSAQSGAQSILRRSQSGESRGASRVFRGYGQKPPARTRPSAFERPRNNQFERAASDRGFQSRSNAGRITNQGRGGPAVSPGAPRPRQGGIGAGGGTRAPGQAGVGAGGGTRPPGQAGVGAGGGPRPPARGVPGGDARGFHGGGGR